MFIPRKVIDRYELDVDLDDRGLSIRGTLPWPPSVAKHLDEITTALEFTGREQDDLGEHIANVRLWSLLKRHAE